VTAVIVASVILFPTLACIVALTAAIREDVGQMVALLRQA
jgi:hypothetical protein